MPADPESFNILPYQPKSTERQFYFAVAESADLIKIGVSRELEKRLYGLSLLAREPLVLYDVFTVGMGVETAFHRVMRQHAVLGEWYPNLPVIYDAYELLKELGLAAFLVAHGARRCRYDIYPADELSPRRAPMQRAV